MATELRGKVKPSKGFKGYWYWHLTPVDDYRNDQGWERTLSAAMDAAREAIRKEQERGA